MEKRENLFYGLGLVAYAVAKADGEVQAEEKKELHDLITDWSENIESEFDVTEIIFSVLSKQKPSFENGYELGMKHLALGKDLFTERLKELFLYLIKDVAHAFPPVTHQEQDIIVKFTRDLEKL
ncbi:MAG: TerB family tellurite resistance protein [Salibacteraceae bacterium]|nr:TerB family tellurite resistance protein [Salibacteraceae bacterium]